MNPLRKQFDPHTPFPFEYVYRETKSMQNELPDHLHEWVEIVYVHQGKGSFFIDQSRYDMNQGDLFLIPGNTIHRAFPDGTDPVTSTAIFFNTALVQQVSLGDSFTYLRCFEYARKRKSYKLEYSAAEQTGVAAILEAVHSEIKKQLPGYRQAALVHLQHLLLQMNRKVAPAHSNDDGQAHACPLWLKESLPYIDGHLSGNLSLSALALRASVNAAHFSRVFKQLTGLNVTEYVTAKRIIRAKELLLETDANVSLIAEQCGFESLPHFHRMFKRVTGITPAVYKRNYRVAGI